MTRKIFFALALVFAAGFTMGGAALLHYHGQTARADAKSFAGPGPAPAPPNAITLPEPAAEPEPAAAKPEPAGFSPGLPSASLSRIQQLRQSASHAMRAGNPQGAINALAQALALDPDSDLLLREMSHANAAMGWKSFEKKDYGHAVDFFEEAIHYWEGNEDGARGMAFALFRDRKPESAEQWLLYYMGLGGSRPDAYSLLGRIYYDQNRLELALGYLDQSLALMPEQPEVVKFADKVRRELKVEEGFYEERTSHFVIKYEGVETPGLNPLIMMMCEQAYLKVGGEIGYYPDGPITVLLYTREQFSDVTHSPDWAGAIFDGKIRIPVKGLTDRDEVATRIIFHEYTHAALHDMTQGRAPVWLQEGLAQMNEGAAYNIPSLASLVLKNGGPLPLSSLEGGFLRLPPDQARLAYAESYLAAAYINDAFGPYSMRELLRRLKEGSGVRTALLDTTYQEPNIFFEHFKSWIADQAGVSPG